STPRPYCSKNPPSLVIHQGKLIHAMGEYGNLISSKVAASTLLNPSNVDTKSKKEIALPRQFMVDLRLDGRNLTRSTALSRVKLNSEKPYNGFTLYFLRCIRNNSGNLRSRKS